MKKTAILTFILLMFLSFSGLAQESKPTLRAGSDLVSSYVWRGTKFGSGPALQPSVELTAGPLTLGAWGSYSFSENESPEADLYASLAAGPFTIGLTSYYYPGTRYFNADNQAFEINGGLVLANLTFSGNYILNEGAGAQGGDLYFEASLSAGSLNFFAGAGNGWHIVTPGQKFNLCNVGLSASKNLQVSEQFEIPLTGSVILNPNSEQLYVVVGITL